MSSLSLWKRSALVIPLIFALYLLADDDNDHHHLAVLTALKRHPPSRRVYRGLLELTLLLFGVAASLFFWSKTVGNTAVGVLLFQPADESASMRRNYRRVASSESDNEDDEDNNSGDEEPIDVPTSRILTEEEAQDAYYDSDGEVPTPPHLPSSSDCSPPSAHDAASVAVDSLLLVFLSLLGFTLSSAEGGRYIDGMPDDNSWLKMMARIAAPVFPLLLFVAAVLHAALPWKRRKGFWQIISYTIGAPFYSVTFRDGFVGDIFTSTVRPMQDLAFTAFYIVSGLRGWWTQAYNLDNAAMPLERSWLLHTCILPACMVSPLWWRFLQNLRQSYETKQRWPYLGNAFKYFIAAEVAMFGVFDPSKKQSFLWILSFVAATLYQIWWDVFMDWELIHFHPNGMPRLRSMRLYPSKRMYWTILIINFVLRFCWTLSFLPRLYLDQSGILSKSFHGNFTKVIGPIIASAEIIRRTLWGLLRLEWEAIRSCREDKTVQAQLDLCSDVPDVYDNEVEMQPLARFKNSDDGSSPTFIGTLLVASTFTLSSPATFEIRSDMSARSEIQILGELCLWATAFASLGIVAAAHRETL